MASLALCGIVLAGCGGGIEPGAPQSAIDGGPGVVSFETVEAYDFPDMARPDLERITIAGRLVLPEGEGEVRGAAILSHGSGGTGSRQDRMADRLAEAGYAALVLDHFGPRNVGSTVRDQLRVTAQGMLADVMAARDLLATHPRIPADKIGVMGWSKGAITAVLGAVDRLAGYADETTGSMDDRLAFAVAFYPFCGFDLGEERLASPLLMLLGSADDWTPAPPCRDLAAAWDARGQPARVVVYDGAPHGFDSRLPTTLSIGRAITVRERTPACTLTLDDGGRTVTVDGAHRLDSLEARQAWLAVCGVRGVTFGGDSRAREAAFTEVFAFLDEALGEDL